MGMGARARRTKRIMASSLGDFVRECQGAESDRESFRRNWSGGFGYRDDVNEWGQPSGVRYITTPLGTHRDAEALNESNWSVINPTMDKADSFGHVSEHAGTFVHTEGSCLNGWNDSVMVRIDDAVALREAMNFVNALSDYPVLDEEDYSQREWDANHSDGKCWAENCDCAQGAHDRLNEESEDGEHAGCRAWLSGSLPEQDKAGWRTFGSSDVSEEYDEDVSERTGDYKAEYIAHMTSEDDPRETYYSYNPDHDRLELWQWYCGADGCGHWIEATQADLRIIRRHRLFSDLPPAPTVSLVKGVGGTQGKLF